MITKPSVWSILGLKSDVSHQRALSTAPVGPDPDMARAWMTPLKVHWTSPFSVDFMNIHHSANSISPYSTVLRFLYTLSHLAVVPIQYAAAPDAEGAL